MKKLTLAIASVFTVLVPAAFAQDYSRERDSRYDSYQDNSRERDSRNDSYQDRQWSRGRESARVIETRPLYNAANAREECWNQRAGHYEEVRKDEHGRKVGTGTVVGAVAGGVIGHQVGDNNAGTALGALLGGLVGNQIENSNRDEKRQDDLDFSRCRVASKGDIQGYDVRYDYRGREYTARMDHDPGQRLVVGTDTRDDGRPINPVAWR